MLDSVLQRTTAKLEASGTLTAPAIDRLMRALTTNRVRSVADLNALLQEPAGPARGGQP